MKKRKHGLLAASAALAVLTQSAMMCPSITHAETAYVHATYASSDAQLLSGAAYHITNVGSGKLLSAAADGNVQQWESTNDSMQSWRIVSMADGYCKLLSSENPALALTVENADGTDGNNVYLSADTGAVGQQFKVEQSGTQYYITTRCSNGESALDVYDISTENGANICQWEYWGGNGQLFEIIPVANTYSVCMGDVNLDGCLDALDLALLKGGLLYGFDTITAGVADLNQSGAPDAGDAALLRDYLVRRTDGFAAQYYELPYTVPVVLNPDGRQMEYLDRGTVAVSTGSSVFVSWRSLATDAADVGFNVYRTTEGTTTKLNDIVLTGGTNYTDTTADLTKNNTYFVKAVRDGVEYDTDGDYTLSGNSTASCITVPIQAGGTIHFVWVGDFNGDGCYDYLVDRTTDEHQKLEAYLNDGTYLWTIDLGYNSENKNNISPGASTIDVGMWDGATVYDMDCDGTAEVMVRIADGVTMGDGTVYSNSVANAQAIAVVDGMTGALEASAAVPDNYIAVGPVACMMEVGYLDGKTPSLVCWFKNRNSDKTFNSMMTAYHFENGEFVQQWLFDNNKFFAERSEYQNGYAEAHQIRIADVDYDGKDEVLHMGYCLNGDGSLRYVIDSIVHGDRWYVGSFCNSNNEKEMMGYGIQQDNASGLLEYFYNASTGEVLWTNYAAEGTADVARGNVGDIDPNYDGFECWSFQGIFNQSGTKITDNYLYPVIRLWWDGDLLSESYNDGKIEEWDYVNQGTGRLVTTWKITDCIGSDRGAPMFYGDILGDWREEVIMTSGDYSKLVILTTTAETSERIYCLAQNPCYRNCMTAKGYYQSHMLDYYLGSEMEAPETPNITIIGQ